MFAGLSIQGLVEVVGHTDWKGFVAGETLILVTTGFIDVDVVKTRLEAATKRSILITSKEESVPSVKESVTIRTLTIGYAKETVP
jgi:hypothetical protein